MSIGKYSNSYRGNFTDAWERIKNETNINNFKELGMRVGVTQPSISGRKKTGDFPIEWAYLLGREYNLSTEWILTGQEPKGKNEEVKERFLVLVDQWLSELVEKSPERREWFKCHFIDSFTKFEIWLNAKEVEEMREGFLGEKVRESVD